MLIAQKLPEKALEENTSKLNLTRGNKILEIVTAVPAEPPNPSHSQFFSLICDTLSNYVENLEELITSENIKLGELAAQPFTPKQSQNAVDVLEYTWKPIHDLLEFTLRESDNEMQVQQSLHNIQSLINLSGSLGLTIALQCILASLCNWQLPLELGILLDWKNK